MRTGKLPGMEEALREEMRRRRERDRRRAFLASLAGIVAAGGAGLWVGARWLTSPPALDDLVEARRLARAPLDDLVARYVEVLDAIDLYGGDGELWFGVRRLGRWALAAPAEEDRARVARQIERTLAVQRGLPDDVAELLATMRRRRRPGEDR